MIYLDRKKELALPAVEKGAENEVEYGYDIYDCLGHGYKRLLGPRQYPKRNCKSPCLFHHSPRQDRENVLWHFFFTK